MKFSCMVFRSRQCSVPLFSCHMPVVQGSVIRTVGCDPLICHEIIYEAAINSLQRFKIEWNIECTHFIKVSIVA